MNTFDERPDVRLLKPGILVALKTQVAGGVSYTRRDLANQTRDTGEAYRAWETECVTADPEEHERATKLRSAVVQVVRGKCIATNFGLLCPVDREQELDQALELARARCDEHNATAKHTRVYVYALKGRIASSDEQAMRSLGAELASLMRDMDRGIQSLDPEAIRKAAADARALTAMLDESQVKIASDAIEQARKAAREIVARVEKKGEEGATVLAALQTEAIRQARIAFLDFDAPKQEPIEGPPEPPMPQANVQRFAGLEGLSSSDDPAPLPEPQVPAYARPDLDMGGW